MEEERVWLASTTKLAIIERETGHLVGWCGISGDELGCRLRRESWGLGYATEACEAVVWASGLRVVVATLDDRNGASKRILAKLGFIRHPSGWYVFYRPGGSR